MTTFARFLALGGLLVGCDVTGACASQGATPFEVCGNDYEESACQNLSGRFYEGKTCPEAGYTQACSKAEHNCYCHVGDPYCP